MTVLRGFGVLGFWGFDGETDPLLLLVLRSLFRGGVGDRCLTVLVVPGHGGEGDRCLSLSCLGGLMALFLLLP